MTPTHLQILRLISAGQACTRAWLMAQTGLSKAAISGLTRDLLDGGFLLELGPGPGTSPGSSAGAPSGASAAAASARPSGAAAGPGPDMGAAAAERPAAPHSPARGQARKHGQGTGQGQPQTPKQGRPSALLTLNPAGAVFAGVSMMSDPALIALVDLSGAILASTSRPRLEDPAAFAASLDGALDELAAATGLARSAIRGLGLALSGLVDPGQEVVIRSTLLGLRDVPLAAQLRNATGLPAFIENDAKALAVSEKLFGAARDLTSFTMIWLGGGIGAAHFMHGGLYRGAHGGAGEIAHVTVNPDGLPCRCGKTGCLDTVASMTAIRDAARAAGIPIHRLTELEDHAARGNAAAIRLLHQAGAALGLAIAQVIQINDPERVLVTHREAAFDGLFARVMQQTIEANVLPSLSGITPLHLQRLTDLDWVKSAASVATHRFLNGTLLRTD